MCDLSSHLKLDQLLDDEIKRFLARKCSNLFTNRHIVIFMHELYGYLNYIKLGLMAGCAFKDVKMAINIVPMVLMPLIIYSGFFANSKSFFVWIGWL